MHVNDPLQFRVSEIKCIIFFVVEKLCGNLRFLVLQTQNAINEELDLQLTKKFERE